MIRKLTLMLTALMMIASPSLADATDTVNVHDAWTRPTANANSPAGVFLTITNNGDTPVKLIGFSASNAHNVMLHSMMTEDGMTRMVMVKTLEIAANSSFNFSDEKYHLMLTKMTNKISKGDHFTVTLTFEDIGDIEVTVMVTGMGGLEAMKTMGDMGTMGDMKGMDH